MIKKILSTSILVCMGLFFIQSRASAITAREIIKKSENLLRGNTQVSIITVTVKTRRWTRKMRIKNWENRRTKKSLTEITAPAKDAGNRFLLIKKTMRQYMPKLQSVIKISPSMMLQAWMGSDFTNDDIVKESSIVEDYTHILRGKKTIDGHECYRIVLKPKAKAVVVWGQIIYYARVKDYLPVKEEFYNEHGVLKKVLSFSEYKKMHDRVIPTKYIMKTVKKKNRYTMMRILKARFNIHIPARIFTLQNLKRR